MAKWENSYTLQKICKKSIGCDQYSMYSGGELNFTESELKFALSHLEHWFPESTKIKELKKFLQD